MCLKMSSARGMKKGKKLENTVPLCQPIEDAIVGKYTVKFYLYPSKLCRIQFFGGERGCNFVKKSREVYDHSNEHLSPLQSSCKMAYQNPCTFGILISTLSLTRVWTWLPKKKWILMGFFCMYCFTGKVSVQFHPPLYVAQISFQIISSFGPF